MASSSSCFALAAIILMCLPLPGPAKFLSTDSKHRAGVSSRAIRLEVEEALHEAMGHGHAVPPERLAQIEADLRPLLTALPRNEHGRWAPDALRYAVHRYFERTHGWAIKGFAPHTVPPSAAQGNSTAADADDDELQEEGEEGPGGAASEHEILRQRIPGYVEQVLERKLNHQGFDLADAVTMVVALQRMIFDESLGTLERAYALNGLNPGSAPVVLSNGQQVGAGGLRDLALRELVVSFMMVYMNQLDDMAAEEILPWGKWHSRGLARLARHHAAEKADVQKAHSGLWRPGEWVKAEAQGAMAEQVAANPFARRRQRTYDFEFVAEKVIVPATARFGKWHNEECMELKDLLVGLDQRGTGRVRFPKFYGQTQGKWHLAEPLDYLRVLGVLDESSQSLGPQVIIPNYVQSLSNCVEPSAFYSVCCLNECEAVLGALESEAKAPFGSVEQIVDVVSNFETTSMSAPRGNLTKALMAQLEEVSSFHQGRIPLHGRLLAQWLHYAFPRECPFPHKRDEVEKKVGATAWMDAGNQLPATAEEVAALREQIWKEDRDRFGEAAASATVGGSGRGGKKLLLGSKSNPEELEKEMMTQWTLEEELTLNMTMALAPREGWVPAFLQRQLALPQMGLFRMVLLGLCFGGLAGRVRIANALTVAATPGKKKGGLFAGLSPAGKDVLV